MEKQSYIVHGDGNSSKETDINHIRPVWQVHGLDSSENNLKLATAAETDYNIAENQENLDPTMKVVKRKRARLRTASFTDLRPEDKKRVANLIQEMSELGRQKGEIEALLQQERTEFETVVQQLINDQKKLLLEHQSMKVELEKSQHLLSQLQENHCEKKDAFTSYCTSHLEQLPRSLTTAKPERSNVIPFISASNKTNELDSYLLAHNSCEASTSTVQTTIDADRYPDYNHDTSNLSSHKLKMNSDLIVERSKLIQEQKQLRKKLFEQEKALRHAQQELRKKQEQYHQEAARVSQPNTPRSILSARSRSSHKSISTATRSPEAHGGLMETSSVGAQDSRVISPNRSRQCIGNRIVPSPDSRTDNSSIERALQRTASLLQSARKVIEETNCFSPRIDKKVSLDSIRKSPNALFEGGSKLTLDNCSDNGDNDNDMQLSHDITESDLLKDVFFVK